MVDLGISRIRDFQSTLPGVKSTERVHGDKLPNREKRSAAAPPSEGRGETVAESEKDVAPVELDREQLERQVEELNRILGGHRSLRSRVSTESADRRIEIVDTRSGKVIKTVPPSEIRSAASRLQSGSLLVDGVS